MIAAVIAECPSLLYVTVAVEDSSGMGLVADCRIEQIAWIIPRRGRERIILNTFLPLNQQSAISPYRPQTQCKLNHLHPLCAVLHSSAIVSNQTCDDCGEMPPVSFDRFEHLQ